MSFTHLVRLEQISDPSNFVESRTNKPKNRTQRLYDNYRSVNGLNGADAQSTVKAYKLYDKFEGVPESDIRVITMRVVYTETF